ncbi:MAG: FHA domain-containing protein [Planctomycetota bacterium]|nr:FHA domain-containing protein [Planctomycetota bacterium]
MPKLHITENGDQAVYEIFEDEVGLGRGAANQVQLHGGAASKMHAVVRRLQGHWKFIDLESKNGSLVNGRFRNQHWLSDGDVVTVGEASVRFEAAGAAQGSPAAGIAVKPRVLAAPARAVSGPPAAAVVLTPADTFQSVAPAAETPVVSRARRGGAPGRARRSDDDYDDYDDYDDDAPPPRRKSGSGTIVLLGILGAGAFMIIMFAMFAGGSSDNQSVFIKAGKMADSGRYEEALKYAETHSDPGGDHYWAVVKGMEDWRKAVVARADALFEEEASKYFDYQIYRKQAVTGRRRGGFRAKDALSESDVAALLREFLLKYPNTAAARALMAGEQSDYVHLRDCMTENRDANLRSMNVMPAISADHDIDVSARRYGTAYQRLDYLQNAYRFIMTSENYTEFRNALQLKTDDVLDTARSKWRNDRAEFDSILSSSGKAKARKKLGEMRASYGAIPEFSSQLTALEQRV